MRCDVERIEGLRRSRQCRHDRPSSDATRCDAKRHDSLPIPCAVDAAAAARNAARATATCTHTHTHTRRPRTLAPALVFTLTLSDAAAAAANEPRGLQRSIKRESHRGRRRRRDEDRHANLCSASASAFASAREEKIAIAGFKASRSQATPRAASYGLHSAATRLNAPTQMEFSRFSKDSLTSQRLACAIAEACCIKRYSGDKKATSLAQDTQREIIEATNHKYIK